MSLRLDARVEGRDPDDLTFPEPERPGAAPFPDSLPPPRPLEDDDGSGAAE